MVAINTPLQILKVLMYLKKKNPQQRKIYFKLTLKETQSYTFNFQFKTKQKSYSASNKKRERERKSYKNQTKCYGTYNNSPEVVPSNNGRERGGC